MFMVEIVYGKFLNNGFMQDKVCVYNRNQNIEIFVARLFHIEQNYIQ